MILTIKDIEREDDRHGYIRTTNLPFYLQGYYTEDDGGYFALYDRESEIRKIGGIKKEDAEFYILGVIDYMDNIKSELYTLGFID